MTLAKDYQSVMGRSNEIQKEALGLDYSNFETSPISFDYDALMNSETLQSLHVNTQNRVTAQEFSQKTNPATHPVPSKTDVRLAQLLTLRN